MNNPKGANDETIEGTISFLLTRYDGVSDKKSSESDKNVDMTKTGLLERENAHLKTVIEYQHSIIETFRQKYQDLSIEYNNKIDRLREEHLGELEEMHRQFKDRLSKINDNRN